MTSIIRKKLRGRERNKREKSFPWTSAVQKRLSRQPKVLRRTRWKRSKGKSKVSAQCILLFAKKKKILKKLWHTHTKNWNREKHNIKRKQTLNTAMRERIQQRLYVCMAQRFARSKIPLRRRRGLAKPPTLSRVSSPPFCCFKHMYIYNMRNIHRVIFLHLLYTLKKCNILYVKGERGAWRDVSLH